MTTRDAITELLFVRDPPRAVDLAMVLGCPQVSNMDPAIALYREGLTGRILITGHGPAGTETPEWRLYQAYALEQGLPASALLVEPDARNTQENFTLGERLVAEQLGWDNVGSIAIVTRPVHTRRALMTARRILPDKLELVMLSPSDDGAIQADTWWRTPYGRKRVLGELRRIGEYGLKDHLGDF